MATADIDFLDRRVLLASVPPGAVEWSPSSLLPWTERQVPHSRAHRNTTGPDVAFKSPGRLGSLDVTRDITYQSDSGRLLKLDVYLPSGERPSDGWPVVMAIHGGGWRRYNKDSYGARASALTRLGFAVVAPNYTLSAPGFSSWPTNLQDVRGAARWIRLNANVFGLDPTRIAAMGESAGAHLALMLGLTNDPLAGRAPSARIQAVADFFGPTDLLTLAQESPGAASAIRQFLGAKSGQNPALFRSASPIDHVDASDPPVFLAHGSIDTLVPLSQATALAHRLSDVGVPSHLFVVAGAGHGFGFHPAGQDLLGPLVSFLRTSMNESIARAGR